MASTEPTIAFVMYGARDAIVAGLTHAKEQVRSIEQAVIENPSLAFDLARTLVETVCRTILTDRKVSYSDSDDLPRLFKMASLHLPFLPTNAGGDAEVRRSLIQTINGLTTAIHGICELRNRCGFASHGSDGPRPAMESVQALMAAQAADTIVGFLHRVHRQDRTVPELASSASTNDVYDENSEFNTSVDETHDLIRIFDIELRPSEVLFQMEPESYRNYLAEFEEDAENVAVDMEALPRTVP